MKRFIITSISLVLLFGFVIVGVHIYGIWKFGVQIEREYTLQPHQKYLFLGSSLFGCGIIEAREYENKVVWISETSTMNALIRLREFERRNQLFNVRVVAIPCNFGVQKKYTEELLPWSFYQELPISWRYVSDYPCSRLKLVAYILSNLRFSLPLVVNQKRPMDRHPICERTQQDQCRFYEGLQSTMDTICSSKVDGELLAAYKKHILEIQEICRRNRIKLVGIRMPMHPEFTKLVPENVKAEDDELLQWLRLQGIAIRIIDMPLGEMDYFDHWHLVDCGARKVTCEVMEYLNSLGI